jgi:hypothetical protein
VPTRSGGLIASVECVAVGAAVPGRRNELLSTPQMFYFVAQFFLIPPATAFHRASPMSLVRRRVAKAV